MARMTRSGARRPLAPTPLLFALWLVGCAGFEPFDPSAGLEQLGNDRGIVLLHVETDVAISRLESAGSIAARSLVKGEHFEVLVARAGRYRWTSLKAPSVWFGVITDYRLPYRLEELEFRVEPGVINYPGLLTIKRGPGGLYVRNLNRSASALLKLERRHPELVESLEILYTGVRPDPFYERYRRLRQQIAPAPEKGS